MGSLVDRRIQRKLLRLPALLIPFPEQRDDGLSLKRVPHSFVHRATNFPARLFCPVSGVVRDGSGRGFPWEVGLILVGAEAQPRSPLCSVTG